MGFLQDDYFTVILNTSRNIQMEVSSRHGVWCYTRPEGHAITQILQRSVNNTIHNNRNMVIRLSVINVITAVEIKFNTYFHM